MIIKVRSQSPPGLIIKGLDNQAFHHVSPNFSDVVDGSRDQTVKRIKIRISVTGQVDPARRSSLSPDTLTLLVFMDEDLPLIRKIRADKMVGDVCGELVQDCSIDSWNLVTMNSD